MYLNPLMPVCEQVSAVREQPYSHIYSYIKVVFLPFLYSLPFGIPAFAQHLQLALLSPTVHDQADGIPGQGGRA